MNCQTVTSIMKQKKLNHFINIKMDIVKFILLKNNQRHFYLKNIYKKTKLSISSPIIFNIFCQHKIK